MEATAFPTGNYIADIVVLDKHERIVLLVEVKAKKLAANADKQQAFFLIKHYLNNVDKCKQLSFGNKPFIMLVDLVSIIIFQDTSESYSEPLLSMQTSDILNSYDDTFSELSSKNHISGFYLETLVEAWLRDLAYHWKSPEPPASDRLKNIGLLQLIEGGTTLSQVNLDEDTVR
ncbi:hypothetical protein CLI64_26250 [Nostoc sp. CENA543]|uniref:hypothetical protein n=1 Tax=Nostoc sp. CENA543 TaxID=1869241 RepID=UPI000CA32DA0|nr:hypothetical protein [Nostoc sp. CENA543]AUT03624.1 hypothetical protein CLI64_26250 [Nostoc sp. CENA543]